VNKLGSIYLTYPKRVVVGSLNYDPRAGTSLVGLDLAALLPILRETEAKELCGYCEPAIEIDEPPYIQADIQWCLKTKRIKLGWICSDSDATGEVTYAVRLDVEALLKRFDCIFIHCHPTNVKEE